MNTDVVTAVSDGSTDRLDVLFNTEVGRRYLVSDAGVPPGVVEHLSALGLSSICNVLAAIKTAKYYGFGSHDVLVTVATDGAAMYDSERAKSVRKHFPDGFDSAAAGETFATAMLGADTDHLLELSHRDRSRVFNLGYFTWVEQQGVPLPEFAARRESRFWIEMRRVLPVWDQMIQEFNARTGVMATL